MRAQGGHDVDQPLAKILVGQARELPGHAVQPREIGGQGQNPAARLEPAKRFGQRGPQLLRA